MHNEDEELRHELANRIRLLFSFAFTMIPDIELLEKTTKDLHGKQSRVHSTAPLLTAFGIDYDSTSFELDLRYKRSEALLNLIKVLKETEDERTFKSQQDIIKLNRKKISDMLGI